MKRISKCCEYPVQKIKDKDGLPYFICVQCCKNSPELLQVNQHFRLRVLKGEKPKEVAKQLGMKIILPI